MPIFQYDPYRNPYGPSIAEALAHQADPQAAAALRTADLQARADERAGALQGQLWSTLGAIPAQIQAQQVARQEAAARAQQLQIGGLQLDAAQREARSRNLFEAESQNPANQNPDGSINDDKFLNALRRQDVGAYQKAVALKQANQKATLDWTKGIADLNASSATADEKRAAAQKLRQDYLGTQALAAYTGLQQKPDDPLHARDWALGLATTAVSDNAVSPAVANQWIRQLAGAGPDQVGAALLSAVPPEMKAKYDKEQAEARASRAAALRPINVGPGTTAISPPNPDQPGAPPTVLYTAPETGKAYQKSSVLLDGKPAEVLLDPTPGGKIYDLSGTAIDNAAARVRPIPPASVQVLNQTLAGGQHVSDTAQMIADYKIAPPSSRSLATPAGELLMAQVKAANPAYDATQFPTRQKMRLAFTSGPQSQTINSLNTAIGHLDQFTEVVKALDNGNFQPGNEAYNWLRSTFGQSAPTNFAGIRSIMSGELAAAFKKSGATDQEIASVEQAIASKNSTGQLLDYVQTIALPALGSKVVSFDQQYRQVMGAADPFQILLPESAQILQKYGIDPAHPTMGARAPTGTAPVAPPPPPKGTIRTNPANGQTSMWDGTKFVPVK